MSAKLVITSHVWHQDRCFFVSTIERGSSAAEAFSRYNETIVWAYDWDKRERGEMLYQESDICGSISRHLGVCTGLYLNGNLGGGEKEPS